MRKTINTLAVIAIFVLFFMVFIWGMDRHFKHECLTWKSWEIEYPHIEHQEWAREQCLDFNIELK